ncbi:hypothetical protein K2F43_00370 [Clostridium estertheticum]|uniref:hypothetical protein n=1 Tax=Clostridium estertheticum TaxID=238834 RepID=UPI001C6F349C|nr:hypothetical protein [Clostridium estertheticum]MBW9169657.1 hypothetical protein [Clostridium estertheticum]WLC74827.1 hypothetical protein KTC99_19090 [Clostridium estertheticum]
MKNKKGSALIFILVLTSFLLIVLTAILTMSVSGIRNVDAYNKINSAYYAGEAGVQRVTAIMYNDYKPDQDFSSISVNSPISTCTKEDVKGKVDFAVSAYATELLKKAKIYEYTASSSSSSSSSSRDVINLISSPTSSYGYYIIKSISRVDLNLGDINTKTNYKTSITIVSEGGFKGLDKIEHIKQVTCNLNVNITVRADVVDANNYKLSLGWNITS